MVHRVVREIVDTARGNRAFLACAVGFLRHSGIALTAKNNTRIAVLADLREAAVSAGEL